MIFHYNREVEASMKGYNKGTVGHFIPVNYNGYIDASMKGYSKGSLGPFMQV
jgi:hypothetical protein